MASTATSGIDSPTRAPTRVEVAIVLSLTLAALLLRAWAISRVGLGQYDEGVYALSALGISDPAQPHRIWQSQVRFSPPVYFLLVALAYLLRGGPADTAAVAVNVCFGTLLVPIVWWAGRRWFGTRAGIVAATLTALSQYQILMSRSALTDISFTVFFTLALIALAWAMESGGAWRAVLAGAATGLAWNTKYHGWFVLVIGAAAWIGWTRFGGAGADARRRAARAWIIAAVVATCCYLPWAVFIQRGSGGLEAWSSYFAQMLSPRWVRHFVRHAWLQATLEGPWTRASLPLGAVMLLLSCAGRCRRSPSGQLALVVALGAVALALGGAAGTVLLALAAIWLLRRDRGHLPTWIALTWAALWVVAAPIYRPYFRLLLPFMVVSSILAGVTLDRWLTSSDRLPTRIGVGGLLGGTAVAAVVFVLGFRRPMTTDPWRDDASMRRAADAMTQLIPPHAEVRVIWDPPVAYYLQLAQRNAFEDVDGIAVLDTMTVSRYIVTGTYVRGSVGMRAGMERHADELELLGRYPVQPTDIRLLDDDSPDEARAFRAHPDSTFDLLLYRYRPKGSTP